MFVMRGSARYPPMATCDMIHGAGRGTVVGMRCCRSYFLRAVLLLLLLHGCCSPAASQSQHGIIPVLLSRTTSLKTTRRWRRLLQPGFYTEKAYNTTGGIAIEVASSTPTLAARIVLG